MADGDQVLGPHRLEGSQGRQALIFDAATYELLGERSGAGGGSVDVESGIVDSPTARP